jgi:hypothetical protein
MADCACGCGEATAGGAFRPGHDQRLRADIERRVGGLLALASVVDAAESYVGGSTSLDALGDRLRALFRAQHPDRGA